MAKRRDKAKVASAPPEPGETPSTITPVPPDTLHVTMATLAAGDVLHRVHLDQYAADQFNPGVLGNARFSPIRDAQENPIPTLYAGTTMPVAMMETVFHDVPYTPGFKSFDKGKLTGQQHSTIEVTQDLHLVDLRSVPLRKLGVSRKQLIETEKNQYPATRAWAEAVHSQCPDAQGLLWISRQDDSALACVIFGDRVPAGAIRKHGNSRGLLDDGYDDVLDLAAKLGVSIVPGQG